MIYFKETLNYFIIKFLSEKFGAFKKIFESFSKLSEIQKTFKNPSEENLEARIFEEQKNITLSEMEIDKIEKCNKNIGDYHLTNQKNEFLKKITDLKKEQQNIEFYDKNIGYHQFPAKKNDCMIEILEINKTEQNTIACEKNIVDFKLPNQNNNFMNEIDKKENANVIFFDKKLKDFHYMSQKIYALKGKENLNTSNEDLANYNMNNSNDNFGVTNININENFWFNKSNTVKILYIFSYFYIEGPRKRD